MRKIFALVFVLVAATMLAACSGTPTAVSTVVPTATLAPTQTARVLVVTTTPAATGTPLSTATATLAPVGPQLRTAEEIRDFGRVLGWVTGGDLGQWVAGAQIELKEDFVLKTLPSGAVYEFECVHYTVINGEVHATPVCEGALVRFGTDDIVPKGVIGTFWLPWAVKGSPTEGWEEGFLDEPCLCSDGDCRDE